MRLRCPRENCPLDVPDDLLGARIRCPHCGQLILLDAKDRDLGAEQIQAGEPLATKSRPLAGDDLAKQIYDGLPPLAVMMALRRRHGALYDNADFATKYEMTEDDWRALAAFEFLLHAGYQIRTALIMGAFGVLMNLAVVAGMIAFLEGVEPYARARALSNLGSVIVAAAGLGLIWMAGQSFCRLQWDRLTIGLPWLTFGVAVVLAGSACVNLLTLVVGLDSRVAFLMMASTAVCGLASFAGIWACWRVVAAYLRTRPPEIHHRLAEALKYLE